MEEGVIMLLGALSGVAIGVLSTAFALVVKYGIRETLGLK